ncbi:DNA/RNA non-specific endonuclease [Photobacterium kagoshimensis]
MDAAQELKAKTVANWECRNWEGLGSNLAAIGMVVNPRSLVKRNVTYKAGKYRGIKDGLIDDENRVLIAFIFKGPGEQINYAAMDGNLNKGAWKRMEINGLKP